MTAITFDTHQFIRTLEDSGIPNAHAEAISRAFKNAQHEAEVATKTDIERLHSEMREMELRLTLRIGATMAAAIAVIAALDTFL